VLARSFQFSDLPQASPDARPVTALREHPQPALDAELQRLKANPPVLTPDAFTQFTFDAATATAGKGSLSPLAPTAGTGFEGIFQNGFIPACPTVGAGPLNVFTCGNVSVTVTNKDGTNRVETLGSTFFGAPAAEGPMSEAQSWYDAVHGRFVALAFTQGTAPNFSFFYLAISKTSDARGAWWVYKMDMSVDGVTPTANWSDYQGIGVSDDKLVMSSQQRAFLDDSYQYQKFRVLDRAAAYSGGPLSFVDIVNYAPPVGGDVNDNNVTKPARNLSPGDNTIYCLCVRILGGGRVTYRTITGPPSAPVLSAGNLVTVSSYSPPPDAPQLGGAQLIVTNDCRPTDFYTRNGVLIASWHTAATIGGTGVSALRLFRLRTSDRTVLTDETFGQANTFYYYPAVTVDSVGTIFLGYGRSSATEFASAWATGKRRADATLETGTLLKGGVVSTIQTRWGDYTGIDQDASLQSPSQSVAWYAGEWAKGSNEFGTWVNALSFTYGQVFGTVRSDCDAVAATTGDRAPIAGVTVTLMQGASTVATTTTNASGQYSFGYLESGTYDVVVTPPAGGALVDAIPGSGGTTQTRINAGDVQVAMTNAQASSANDFAVSNVKVAPASTTIVPDTKTAGDAQFTLTVNGSGFSVCSVVRVNGSDRVTTFVNSGQLTVTIPASDVVAAGTRTITVFTPAPGGGTSGGLTLTVQGSGDTTPPSVSITSPVGGESWAAGSVHNITWTATDDVGVTAVDLDLSTSAGASYPFAIAAGLANTGTFAWTVPVNLTNQARIRVTAHDAGNNSAAAASPANFAITGWTINASAGANGSIAPSGTLAVADGATPSYTITPNTGYHVQDVLVNGSSVGAVTNFQFPAVHANQTIAASFAINTYTLTLSTVGSGTAAAVPNQVTYNHGTTIQLTATPAAGWGFDSWSGDTTTTTNPLTFIITSNKNITANFGQHAYVWNQSGTASFATAANWTPPRTTPSTNDVLVFNSGVTTLASGVTAQTIGQLLISGNTNVTLQASSASAITISGLPGPDLSVEAGSTLQLTGSSAVTLAIGSGATGSVAGTVSMTGSSHRLAALDAGSLVFASGSTCIAAAGFTGNSFGLGTGNSGLNSVVFNAGALYVQVAGGNPFGAVAPASVVTFQPGSRFRLDGAVTPSLSGRTYADFEFNVAGTQAVTGGLLATMDTLVVDQGAFNLNMTGGVFIRGNVRVKAGATLSCNPASGTPVFSFTGTAPQAIDVQGTFSNSANAVTDVNNAAGVTLTTNLTLTGPLSFTLGRLNTGTRTLTLATTSSVTGAAANTGWVNGTLKKNFVAGAFSNTLDIGDAGTYTPVAVSGSGAGAGFNLTANTLAGHHPGLEAAGLDSARCVNREWTLSPANAAGASWSATFNFSNADLDAGATPAAFIGRVWNGSAWAPVAIGSLGANSTQATGLSAATPGTVFAFGNPVVRSLSVATNGGGSVSRSPDLPSGYPSGTNVQLTAVPAAGWAFSAWSGALTGNTNPANLVMDADKSVTATFADIQAPTVTVTAPNGGEALNSFAHTSITWTASDNAAVTAVDIALSRTGAAGTYTPIATGIPNTGSYDWVVTEPVTTNGFMRVTAHDAAANTAQDVSNAAFAIASGAGVLDGPITTVALAPVWPNPARGTPRFTIALPEAVPVHLGLLDVQGREVVVLADGVFAPGRHTFDWSAGAPAQVTPGLYFVRLTVPGRSLTQRFALVR
jgi:hypothetical protein